MTDTQYVCVAPLIDVVVGADADGAGGALQRVHQGGGLPLRGLYPVQVTHLLDRGMIVAAEVTGGLESAVVAAALTRSAEAEDDRDGPGPIPAKSASKADWVEYAVTQRAEGVDEDTARADAEAVTKDDLIAKYGS